MENRKSMPLILICSTHEVEPLTTLFSKNDYFSFDSEKVSIYILHLHELVVLPCSLCVAPNLQHFSASFSYNTCLVMPTFHYAIVISGIIQN